MKVTKSFKGSYSSSWLTTLKRRMNSLTDCFVWPELGDMDWWYFRTSFAELKARAAKAQTQICNPRQMILCCLGSETCSTDNFHTQRRAADRWMADPLLNEGGYWVAKPEPNVDSLKGRVADFEDKMCTLEWKLGGTADEARSEQLKLQLARGKKALLASLLLLWDGARTQDIRLLAVNFALTPMYSPT